MDDGRTEPFEPYQPETSYDWDYEEQPTKGSAPKILWGRIIAIAVVLLLAFFLGRATGGGGGDVSQARYDELQEENRQLREDLTAARAQQQPATESPAPPDDNETESPPPDDGESVVYTVKPGDTLRGIAEKYYDDASLDDVIADANGIEDATQLVIGQELIIPPKPEE